MEGIKKGQEETLDGDRCVRSVVLMDKTYPVVLFKYVRLS